MLNLSLATGVTARGMALAASAAAHVAIFAAAGLGAGHAPARVGDAPRAIDVDVELAQLAPDAPKEAEPELAPQPNLARAARTAARPTHTHPYPVPEDHDAHPHDPSIEHPHAAPHEDAHDAPSAPSEAAATATTSAPAARFTMSFGGAARATGGASSALGAGDGRGAHADGADDARAIVPESGVSVRARVASRAPLAYPFGAEDLEADVGLEIVVGLTGAVEDARVVRRAGHGFDEAALAAIRAYRFTPAERSGRPVRVRMPWTVQFRDRR